MICIPCGPADVTSAFYTNCSNKLTLDPLKYTHTHKKPSKSISYNLLVDHYLGYPDGAHVLPEGVGAVAGAPQAGQDGAEPLRAKAAVDGVEGGWWGGCRRINKVSLYTDTA